MVLNIDNNNYFDWREEQQWIRPHLVNTMFDTARHWQYACGSEIQTAVERQYIGEEARKLFKKNKEVS